MQPGGPAPYVDNLDDDLRLVACSRLSIFRRGNRCTAFSVRRLSASSNPFGRMSALPELQEQVKELRDNVKKMVNRLKSALFGRPASEFYRNFTRQRVMELAETVIAFGERYREAKAAKGMVDFNDQQHWPSIFFATRFRAGPYDAFRCGDGISRAV